MLYNFTEMRHLKNFIILLYVSKLKGHLVLLPYIINILWESILGSWWCNKHSTNIPQNKYSFKCSRICYRQGFPCLQYNILLLLALSFRTNRVTRKHPNMHANNYERMRMFDRRLMEISLMKLWGSLFEQYLKGCRLSAWGHTNWWQQRRLGWAKLCRNWCLHIKLKTVLGFY